MFLVSIKFNYRLAGGLLAYIIASFDFLSIINIPATCFLGGEDIMLKILKFFISLSELAESTGEKHLKCIISSFYNGALSLSNEENV